MSETREAAVARHYGAPGLAERVAAALVAAGFTSDRLEPEDLAPIDEFHIGGREATAYTVGKMGLRAGAHVLDIGCGFGGAARYLAATVGCRVTGIDLTPEYIAIAEDLTRRTGLADRVDHRVASALAMPFADRAFDAAITLHVAMNIEDRAGLYREAARVLRPGAVFAIYDVMKGRNEGLTFPVPWADTPATSHLTTPEEMEALLREAGFDVLETEDRTDSGITFFRERLATAAGGPPPVGLHVIMGATARRKFENVLANLESRSIAPVLMIARRAV